VVSFTGLTKYSNGSSSSKGLSTGGIAGLGAVAGCVVVAVIVVVVRVMLKKRSLRLALGRPSSRSAGARSRKYGEAKNNPPVIIESKPMPSFMNNMTKGPLIKNSSPPPLELKGVSSSPLRMASISHHRHSPKHFIPTAANTPIAPFSMVRGLGAQQAGPTVQVQMVPSYFPVTMYANNNFHKH
jgi:hypothetical protein